MPLPAPMPSPSASASDRVNRMFRAATCIAGVSKIGYATATDLRVECRHEP
ncbi:hypothetical protein BCL76_10418 [Streptomyces sp. CG 926]|nr:hypothetical protein BCL76_10418 [Streptomyces sp. CG 926]